MTGVKVLNQEEHTDSIPQTRRARSFKPFSGGPRRGSATAIQKRLAVAVQRPTLDQLERLGAETNGSAAHSPRGTKHCISVDQARRAAEQREIILEVFLALGRPICEISSP